MARIRSVKPEICLSETMAQLPAELERTFVRLWTHCDDEGRCRDNPRLIKAAIYPLHDDIDHVRLDVELTNLADVGLIVRYALDGVRYLAVPSWREHQHPQRPQQSKIPPPPEPSDLRTDDVEHDRGRLADGSRNSTRQVADESGPVVVAGEGEVEGEGENTPPNTTSRTLALAAPASPPSATVSDRFEAFWKLYPRKTGRAEARKAWDRARKRASMDRIDEGLAAHLGPWTTFEEQFIPHPATWLNGGRYDDPPPKPRTSTLDKPASNRAKIAASLERMTRVECHQSAEKAPTTPADDLSGTSHHLVGSDRSTVLNARVVS